MFKTFEKITDSMLAECEKELNMRFPNEYKGFILNTNGGVFDDLDHGFYLGAVDEDIDIHVLYGVNAVNSFDILYHYKENKIYLPNNAFLVGHTYSGDPIMYFLDGPDKGLYLWDSSLYYEPSTADECTYYICENFDEFLDLIGMK